MALDNMPFTDDELCRFAFDDAPPELERHIRICMETDKELATIVDILQDLFHEQAHILLTDVSHHPWSRFRGQSEKDVLVAASDGDQEAVVEVICCESDRLWPLTAQWFDEVDDRSALLEEWMIGLVKTLPRFDPAKGEFRGWSETILANAAASIRRRGSFSTSTSDYHGNGKVVDQGRCSAATRIGEIGPSADEALLYRLWYEDLLTEQEIASQLQMPANAVVVLLGSLKSRIHRLPNQHFSAFPRQVFAQDSSDRRRDK